MNLNTKYFKARYSFVVILGLLSAVTHAQAPVAKWVATPEETTSFPNQVSPNHAGKLNNIDILWKVEDLIDHPSAWFNGDNSFIAIKNTPELNPKEITVSVWFKLPEGIVFGQKPLALKSAPTHEGAMYQYGLFVSDDATNPKMLAFYLSLGGKMVYNVANNLPMHNGWNKVTATYNGKAIRLYCNGAPQGEPVEASGPIDAYDTPLILGAYGNLDKEAQYCFQGYISEVSVYDTALSVESIEATFKAEEEAYPKAGETAPLSDYASQINTVLEEGKDVWGETLIAEGGATYNSIKDLLRPLFYSTGHKNTELGVHNLLFGEVGGEPPYIIPLADGSRLAANVYQSNEYIEWRVGEEKETFGADLTRLGGPYLYKQYLPALQTTYTDTQGNLFEQESFATHIDGHEGLVALVKMDITSSSNEA